MPHKFLAFDIETAKQFPGDFSDWQNHRPLGICCAATVAGNHESTRVWHGCGDDGNPSPKMTAAELAELVSYLAEMVQQGYSIVTWNGLQFDFNVLAEESGMRDTCRELAVEHVDLMFQVVCQQGHVLSLAAAANGMGLRGKMDGMSGVLAPELWSRGEYDRVLEYVQQDARLYVGRRRSRGTEKTPVLDQPQGQYPRDGIAKRLVESQRGRKTTAAGCFLDVQPDLAGVDGRVVGLSQSRASDAVMGSTGFESRVANRRRPPVILAVSSIQFVRLNFKLLPVENPN